MARRVTGACRFKKSFRAGLLDQVLAATAGSAPICQTLAIRRGLLWHNPCMNPPPAEYIQRQSARAELVQRREEGIAQR